MNTHRLIPMNGYHNCVTGDVVLLPALGACLFRPRWAVTLLEISLPEGAESE